ncbi:hypothetical protein R1A27_13195 [Methylobacterium sp. NMS12]|uniref:hypothetical protein n=1 Tax=Methylobacterium sp. NMS12 TaxID=3079766 RepID=UPI003F885D55
MSMEAYALCARAIPGVAEWQAAIDATGFDLKLDAVRMPPATQGHLPATWRRCEAGFECQIIPLSDLTDTYTEIDFGGPWTCVYAFYFATLPACAGAWMAVAACAAQSDGIVFDPQEGQLLTAEAAIRYAHDTVARIVGLDAPFDTSADG